MRLVVAIAVLSIGCSKKEQAVPADPKPTRAEPPRPAPPKTGGFDELASALRATVTGQGTAELDDTPGADRWAHLTREGGARAAYVVEAGGKAFLAEYDADGRTQRWSGDPRGTAIVHRQGHRAGYQRWELAVRQGELVVLREESVDDARESDVPVKQDHRDCVQGCPKASERGFTVQSGATLRDLGTMRP